MLRNVETILTFACSKNLCKSDSRYFYALISVLAHRFQRPSVIGGKKGSFRVTLYSRSSKIRVYKIKERKKKKKRQELTGGRSIRVSGAVDPGRPRQLLSRIGYRWAGRVGGRIGGRDATGRGVGRRASFRAIFLRRLGGRL